MDAISSLNIESIYINYPLITLIVVFIISLIIGSFLNVLIYRIPKSMFAEWRKDCCEFLELDNKTTNIDDNVNINIFSPYRSVCPNCFTQISALDNIPILSFILLKAKCRACSNPISARYPFIELLTAVISVLVIYQFGLTITGLSVVFLSYLLIVIANIDAEHMIIPDHLTYIGLWSGILFNLNLVDYYGFTSIESAILAVIIGYLMLWGLYWIFKLTTGKEGFGHGDFKLTALFGAWFGLAYLFPMLIIASILAIIGSIVNSIFSNKDFREPFPFGPYLVIAGWLIIMYKDYLPDYLNLNIY